MKKNNWRNAGRKKITFIKESIINVYENLENRTITLPEIINQDYGYEMHFGFRETCPTLEKAYLQKKYTPLYRK